MITVNGNPIHVTMFPDKTSQVWKLDKELFKAKEFVIEWIFEHEGEIMHLNQLQMLLFKFSLEKIILKLKYLPYGRQDKKIANDTTFALHSFASMLNNMYFNKVIIQDPHSQMALDLIERSEAEYPMQQIENAMHETECDLVCFPDKGAVIKYTKVFAKEMIYENIPTIYGEKVRDQATGNILSYKVIGDCKGNSVLICDDIADGGMTFKILAKDLLTAGARSVNLFVTHGIFSKGIQTLKDSGISRIFTQDGEVK